MITSEIQCHLCGGADVLELLRRHDVPVHQNLLFASAAEARVCPRGTFQLCICQTCGFMFNSAFDERLMAYGEQYENAQGGSPAVNDYVSGLIDQILSSTPDANQYLEVGCGNGRFIRHLAQRIPATHTAVGMDPSYQGPLEELSGRLRFEKEMLSRCTPHPTADVAVARHVIEHVMSPVEFMAGMAECIRMGKPGTVYIETPCAEWILRNDAFWDLYYEHCCYFSAETLAHASARAGLRVRSIDRVFGEQYLWLTAVSGSESADRRQSPEVIRKATLFAAADAVHMERHRERLAGLSNRGRVVIWGAGAKTATYLSLLDPDERFVHCVVDVNPRKQGAYIAGTGHAITAPEDLNGLAVSTILVLNPNYLDEISHLVRGLSNEPSIVPVNIR